MSGDLELSEGSSRVTIKFIESGPAQTVDAQVPKHIIEPKLSLFNEFMSSSALNDNATASGNSNLATGEPASGAIVPVALTSNSAASTTTTTLVKGPAKLYGSTTVDVDSRRLQQKGRRSRIAAPRAQPVGIGQRAVKAPAGPTGRHH
ncbi:MAG: hypothetical protein R2857_03440 [Vampirovibrionales bacterium]